MPASSRSTWRGTTRSSAAPSQSAAIVLATLEELAPGLAGWQADGAWRERARTLAAEWNKAVDAATRAAAGPADRRAGAGRRQSRARQGRDGRVRRGRAARRAAQALALPGTRRLSRRVRLLLHGLRDRGRPRREDGGPRPHGRRARRRRQLPHDELRDRDLGRERAIRSSSCSATTAASAASTGCSARPRARRTTTCWKESFPAETPVDFVAHARALGADAAMVADVAALEAAVAKARGRNAHDRDRDRDRPAERHRRGRRLVERAGRRGLGRRARARGARGLAPRGRRRRR